MLVDGRQLVEGTTLQADLCVVGGGAAGIAIARALSGTSLQVVLIESGGVNPDSETQSLYEGDVVGEPLLRNTVPMTLSDARLRFLGGSTNHWAGWCRPFQPIDLEPRDDLDQPGWPLSRDDLDPWYQLAHEVCRLGPFEYDPAEWQRGHETGEAIENTNRMQTDMFQITFPMPFGHTYLEELRAAANLRVLLWSSVTELETDEAGTRVTTARVATLDGPTASVQARAFVLAAGGLEVPRLLLASRARHPAGLANDHDLVGRNFAEHLHLPAGYVVFNRSPDALKLYSQTPIALEQPDREIKLMGILSPTAETLRTEGLLGVEAQLNVEPFPSAAPTQDLGAPTAQTAALLEATEQRGATSIALVAAVGQQRLNPDSRVTLTGEVDALGMPRIALDWRYTTEDRANLLAGLAIIGDELAQLGVGRLQLLPGALTPIVENVRANKPVTQWLGIDPTRIDPDGFAFGVGFHHMCTTRMDPSPLRGVVDTDCRAHSVDNLYIAGSAVFPTPGIATPTLTIVALALRLADHLKQELAP